MKKLLMALAAIAGLFPLLAQASCESVKTEISHKIIANGVAESDFSLDILPNDQASSTGGQVVGHCENDSQKIVYTRSAESASATDDAPAP